LARFADATVRWLLFGSGLLGTAMIAAGLVLWTAKRRAERTTAPGRAAAPWLGVADRLNVAVLCGFLIAVVVYFLANRTLPADFPDRGAWETRSFLAAWG